MQLSGLRSWDTVFAWIPFSNSLQWLFSASVTLYVLDYPYCDYWYNFILCNSWVIILLKIYKPAFLLIKYPCCIRAWVPMSFFLPFFLSLSLSSPLQLSLSLSYRWLQTTRFWSIKGPQHWATRKALQKYFWCSDYLPFAANFYITSFSWSPPPRSSSLRIAWDAVSQTWSPKNSQQIKCNSVFRLWLFLSQPHLLS